MHLVPLPALTDNYIWLLHDDEGNAIVVDPGETAVVEQALAVRKLQLRAILLTHHHPDHIGGVAGLLARHAVPVYAPVDERIVETTMPVHDGDAIKLAAPDIRLEVIAIPGHTLSHVAYAGGGLLLCGDTLFSLGCGRLFEGTPAQMLASLDRLATLPKQTMVCGGHEYTAANGRFARTVEPDNAALQARLKEVAELRAHGRPTLPVSLGSELACNPFLRVDSAEVADWCQRQHGVGRNRVARFAALRGAKDVFRG
ncbi:MAG: hydroxyacylglutathione hydrolase [Rhodanobacter sp.]|nr:hydroxyacylglutathione hydrolase [Rhodanobacter sp.]